MKLFLLGTTLAVLALPATVEATTVSGDADPRYNDFHVGPTSHGFRTENDAIDVAISRGPDGRPFIRERSSVLYSANLSCDYVALLKSASCPGGKGFVEGGDKRDLVDVWDIGQIHVRGFYGNDWVGVTGSRSTMSYVEGGSGWDHVALDMGILHGGFFEFDDRDADTLTVRPGGPVEVHAGVGDTVAMDDGEANDVVHCRGTAAAIAADPGDTIAASCG